MHGEPIAHHIRSQSPKERNPSSRSPCKHYSARSNEDVLRDPNSALKEARGSRRVFVSPGEALVYVPRPHLSSNPPQIVTWSTHSVTMGGKSAPHAARALNPRRGIYAIAVQRSPSLCRPLVVPYHIISHFVTHCSCKSTATLHIKSSLHTPSVIRPHPASSHLYNVAQGLPRPLFVPHHNPHPIIHIPLPRTYPG